MAGLMAEDLPVCGTSQNSPQAMEKTQTYSNIALIPNSMAETHGVE
jgi:hypothetical protein